MWATRGPAKAGPYICLVLLLSSCAREPIEQVETQAAVPVAVETARVEALQSTVSASGLVTPAPGAELTVVAPAPARIAEMPKGEGDAVRQGDLLVRFDIPSLTSDVTARRAAVTQAMARVEAARANYLRLSGLLGQGVAASREVEEARRQQAEAEADLEQATSAVETAVSLSDRALVRARFAGVVSKRFHNPGDLVDASAADPVLKIVDLRRLEVVASVPVADLGRVAIGRAARVVVPGSQMEEAAKVLTRAPQLDPSSATAPVRLAFAAPTRLAAGTAVQVDIAAESVAQALVVPAAAVVRDGSETYVMVAGSDGKAHKATVTVGLATHDRVEIARGLKAGDRVIVRGQERLPDGAAIAVQQ